MATKAHEREKLERLCRYIARPAVSTQRLSLTRNGQIRYQLKTPYTDGTSSAKVSARRVSLKQSIIVYTCRCWPERAGDRW